MTAAGSGLTTSWLVEPLSREVALAVERLAASDDVVRVALMPDVHLASEVCVGTVVATRRLLYPGAVGGDIGCGMCAMRFDCAADALADEALAARLLTGLSQAIPVVRFSRPPAPRLPGELAEQPLSSPALERARRESLLQLGTLGRGNHFVELQSDEEGRLWVMLHSGSRAMGPLVRDHHLRGAQRTKSGLGALDAESEAGRAYLADVDWALRYADHSRRAMLTAVGSLVADVLGAPAEADTLIACHHNAVRAEEHFGERLLVHRKGAIAAAEGEPGIIPGSMGTPSYHVIGRGVAEALGSSSHGAGRRYGRGEAARRITARAMERQLEGVWFDHRLAPRLRDEAPGAYKDIDDVMRAQRELTRVVRRLRPILSYKGV